MNLFVLGAIGKHLLDICRVKRDQHIPAPDNEINPRVARADAERHAREKPGRADFLLDRQRRIPEPARISAVMERNDGRADCWAEFRGRG